LDTSLTLGLATLLILLIVAIAGALLLRRLNRRNASLRRLLELADRVEADLKSCRIKLKQAHAVMSMNPDLPAASEQEASNAVDAGLRALLQQRIWIRDRAPTASQGELDAAADAMGQTRDRLRPLLQALGEAQDELDTAMREHIRQDSHS
jgi:HAMP domain-containing protein